MLTISASPGNQFTIELVAPSPTFDPTQTYDWRIARATGGIAGVFNPLAFAIDKTGFVGDDPEGSFSLFQSGNDIFIHYVPEPTSATVMLGFGLGFLAQRRRRLASS
jgi:hypothetical protein